MRDVARAAKAIKRAFGPDKINYGAYSDKLPHLHVHLVPKYEGGPNWGAPFEMMPANKKDSYIPFNSRSPGKSVRQGMPGCFSLGAPSIIAGEPLAERGRGGREEIHIDY